MPDTIFTSALIGQKLVSATGTKLTTLKVDQLGPTTEFQVPLVLIDQATAPANAAAAAFPPKTLYSADLIALNTIFAIKPNGPDVAPGLVDPVWPMVAGSNMNIPIANGVWVQNCPKGVTFTITTA